MFSTIKQELIKFRHMGHFYKAKLEEAQIREISLKAALIQQSKVNAEFREEKCPGAPVMAVSDVKSFQ